MTRELLSGMTIGSIFSLVAVDIVIFIVVFFPKVARWFSTEDEYNFQPFEDSGTAIFMTMIFLLAIVLVELVVGAVTYG